MFGDKERELPCMHVSAVQQHNTLPFPINVYHWYGEVFFVHCVLTKQVIQAICRKSLNICDISLCQNI